MSESVSGVDAILRNLRRSRSSRVAPNDRPIVPLANAEAAVHATARKYEAALARQGAMLDRCRDERLSWEDVQQHSEAAVHATVREIEAMLRTSGMPGTLRHAGLMAAADEVARQFGGTDA